MLSLGPLLLAASMVMGTYLLSFQLIVDEVDTLGVTQYVFAYLPLLLSWAAFSLLYIAVPNCRVHMGCATRLLWSPLYCLKALRRYSEICAHSSYNLFMALLRLYPYF